MRSQRSSKRESHVEIFELGGPSFFPIDPSPPPMVITETDRTRDADSLSLSSVESCVPNTRFVAGHSFFNYAQLGSLRPGYGSVNLFGTGYCGLTVQFFVCGFAFYFCSYGFGRILAEYVSGYSSRQAEAVNYVLSWPQCFVVLIGLISDAKSLWGHRRKSYMILGGLISTFFFVVIVILDIFAASNHAVGMSSVRAGSQSSSPDTYVVPFLILSLMASFGIQISWVTAVAYSVELAQREPLRRRGLIQGILVGVYCLGGAFAELLTSQLLVKHEDHVQSRLSLGSAAGVLACVCASSVPCARWFIQEDTVYTLRDTPAASIKRRGSDFWRFCSQNLVYRVMFFVVGHMFLLALYNINARDAVEKWSHVSFEDSLLILVGRRFAKVFGAVWWAYYLKNYNWRRLAAYGSFIFIIPNVLVTTLTAFDVVRSKWLYGVCVSFGDISRAWLLIYVAILPTEITTAGQEGVVAGMCISFQILSGLASLTVSTLLPGISALAVSDDDVMNDDKSTRMTVFLATMMCVGINLLCLLTVPLLPHQKLDAQQLRAFGGYNGCARTVLLVGFVLLLVFNFAANIVVVV
ncbi:hypothetical protein Poli38472_009315 [Pythium oligandrum]|uniref:Uncharacterized protein n=1 Tax=Pythium oligandrum TaxID=41045 RepID=A0A8K1CLH8_PYTOL|nr:hypothetical protein Poli38472_009315 [Pythium oligandrum]|eukprot:TMW65148.1 hypothetical protein Poli38472_009315 [Pythium oligandrum]